MTVLLNIINMPIVAYIYLTILLFYVGLCFY